MRLHRVAGARTRFRKAAAAVEFAVVSPLLFTAVLGIIEFGRAMMVLELLNNAARAGVQIRGSTYELGDRVGPGAIAQRPRARGRRPEPKHLVARGRL